MNIKKLALLSLVSGMTAFASLSAHATLTLTLFDGTNTVSVSDNGAGDMSGTSNEILAGGTLGVWTYSFQTGRSNAPGGSPSFLRLQSAAASSAAGTLTVTLEDSFTMPESTGASFSTSVGGTTSASVLTGAISGQLLLNNVLLGSTVVPTITTNGSTASFNQDVVNYGNTIGGFTLKEIVSITHSGVQSSDVSMRTDVVPEPAMLGLLGLGLLGFGLSRRRKA